MSSSESEQPTPSTRPYLIRALYEWCTDNGFTPYIAVQADETVQVPREYVRSGEIVLNISADATNALALDNDYIRFKARFGGVVREIIVPIDRVIAIYARETGQGMAFAAPQQPQGPVANADKDAAAPRSEGEFHNPYLAAAEHALGGKEFPSTPGHGRSGIQLVSVTPPAPSGDDPPTPPVPPPPRPTLKRVK